MIFRLKIFLLVAVLPIFLFILFNIFLFIYTDKRENYFYNSKNLEISKGISTIFKEAYLANNFLDIDKYISFLKKTNLSIYYVNLFDKKGEILFSTYKNKITGKIEYIVDNINLEKDFFDVKEFVLDKKLQQTNTLYSGLFLLNDKVKIREYTYFCVLNKKIVASIKIGFLIKNIDSFQLLLKKIKNFIIFKYSLYLCVFILIYWIIISELLADLFLIFKEAINMIVNKKYGINININKFFKNSLIELTNNLKKLESNFIEFNILKKDFISKVTHELRSPLGIIESYLNLMIEEDIECGIEKDEVFYQKIDQKERHFYFLRLLENTKRLKKFINDILDISKIESRKIILNKENVNLEVLLFSIKDFYSIKLKERNIKFIINIDKTINLIYLDKEKMRQLFIILLDNAIKFSYKNSKIEINIKPLFNNKKAIHSILIEVSDEGIGIEEENFEKIFEEFEQVKNFNKNLLQAEKGTGLGLSIAKSIVELHGGIIWVESEFGKGSNFFIKIPAIFIKN